MDSGIPDQLRGTTDPHIWAGAFLAGPVSSGDDEAEVLTAWFAAALETGKHYGAKAALATQSGQVS